MTIFEENREANAESTERGMLMVVVLMVVLKVVVQAGETERSGEGVMWERSWQWAE